MNGNVSHGFCEIPWRQFIKVQKRCGGRLSASERAGPEVRSPFLLACTGHGDIHWAFWREIRRWEYSFEVTGVRILADLCGILW